MHQGSRPATSSAPGKRPLVGPAKAVVENLEIRQLLSASAAGKKVANPVATPTAILYPVQGTAKKTRTSAIATPSFAGAASPLGKTPAEVRGAYGLDSVSFNGIVGDGTGQTIAIIAAYDFPTAANDINAFSTQFGLPTLIANTSLSTINRAAGPTFTKVNQTGSTTTFPATDPAGPYSVTGKSTWAQEAALDIEWAHVMAPKANILLVEANNASFTNLVINAAAFARTVPGVVAVSMSFGANEFSSETSYDTYFTTPASHLGGSATAGGPLLSGGVTFLAASGDYGAYAAGTTTVTAQYPAASPNVVAVGGTNLVTSGNAYVSESAWGHGTSSGSTVANVGGGSGGGVSSYETQPGFQSGTVSAFSTTRRTYPDLSILGDPASGVPIYDSYDYTAATPWSPGYLGGTSLSAPLMAGMVALVNQGRAVNGFGSLDGPTETLPKIYSIARSDYHDVTTGNSGYAAGVGYDLATGIGSPVGAAWINDVGSLTATTPTTGIVSGTIFRDTNADNIFNGSDAVLSGIGVFLDTNNDGIAQAGEPTTTSVGGGLYSFTGVAAGTTGTVRLTAAVSGYVAVAAPTFTVTSGGTSTANLGLFPTAYADSTAGANWVVRLNPTDATQLQILTNTAVAFSAPLSIVPSLSFVFGGTSQSLTVDFSYGTPVPVGGLTYDGTAFGNNNVLQAIGSAAADTITAAAGSLLFNNRTIGYSNVANLTVDPKGGTDSLTVTSGMLRIAAQVAGGGILSRTFSSLSVASGANVLVDAAASRADRTVIVAQSLSLGGQLDLGNADLIVKGGSLAAVNALAASGYSAGAWTGNGLSSSAAAADANKVTALGVALNGAKFTTFDGQSVAADDVLVRYTAYGDADLSGTVDFNDFIAIQVNYLNPTSDFGSGNFDYDNVTDFNDFIALQVNYGTTV